MTLSKSDFGHVRFSSSTLDNVVCEDCRFEHARFHNIIIIHSNLSGSTFADAELTDVEFYRTRLTNLNLTGAILTRTEISPNISLLNSILPNSSFSPIVQRNLVENPTDFSSTPGIFTKGDIQLQRTNNATECWFVNESDDSEMRYELDISTYTVLINADQANFDFSLHRRNKTVSFGAAIHSVNVRRRFFRFRTLSNDICEKSTFTFFSHSRK
jgi:uncharacterized protein YjbI with pentapeptide repeats